jgi:hypothetical protein
MTVQELILELQKLPPDWLVFVEDGLDPSDPTTDFDVAKDDDQKRVKLR